MRPRRSISTAALAAIIIVIIVIAVAGGLAYYYVSKRHVTPTTTTSTTTTTTPTITTTTTTTTTTSTITTTTTITKTTTTTTTTTTTPSVVTITVADSYSTSENAAFNASLAAFEQEYPWIHVEVQYGAPVGTSPYLQEAQAGQAPIVIRETSDAGGALFAAGVLVNLSQYLPPSYFSQFNPTAVEDWTLNGAVYGLPDNINYIVMFYNKKFITAPPNTTDQLIQIAEQVNKTYGVWGIAYGVGDDWGYRFAAWFAGFGGQIFTTVNGKIYPALNSSAMVNALEFWYNLTYNLRVNYLAPSAGAGGVEGQLFMANKAAIIFDGPWDLMTYFNALGCSLGAAPLPVVSSTGLYAAPLIGSTGWVITTPQANGVPKSQWNATLHAALLFIEFMTNYTNEINLWNYARDIPALKSAYNYAISQLSQPATNQTVACLNQVMKGVLEQSLHGQKFPNVPQMAYYWPSFHQYAVWYFSYRNLSAVQAAQGMESYFISQLQANGLLDPALIATLQNLMVAELPASRY